MQTGRNRGGPAIDRKRPGDLVRAEIAGYLHHEQTPLPARQEVSRLAAIRTARLDPIVGTDRNVQLLPGISIEIAQQQIEAAVGILEPALERASDVRARFVGRLERQGLGARQDPESEQE